MSFREWLGRRNRRRRIERDVRKLLDAAFLDPELLRGTSLKPRHRSRYVVLGHDVDDGRIATIHFGILRHPRPYAFSRQHHKVAELYVYDVEKKSLRVVKGINLTRQEGLDAD